eukprot:5893448-Prymnesium_polylepis.1
MPPIKAQGGTPAATPHPGGARTSTPSAQTREAYTARRNGRVCGSAPGHGSTHRARPSPPYQCAGLRFRSSPCATRTARERCLSCSSWPPTRGRSGRTSSCTSGCRRRSSSLSRIAPSPGSACEVG